MKVYVVMGGWDSSGLDENGMKVFDDVVKAEMYAREIDKCKTDSNYHYVVMEERQVE